MNYTKLMEPITRKNIHELEAGEWIWDNKEVERPVHRYSWNHETETEPYGFRQIHILELKDFGTFNHKPFMLSTIDALTRHGYEWVFFEDGRFYRFKRDKEE